MESTLRIHIAARPSDVFALVSAVEDWPCVLPHYRWVRPLGGPGRTLDMAARRTFLPVRWQARVEALPEQLVLRFHHTGGPTRGMDVEWRLTPEGDGTRVELWHRFHSHAPLIAPLYEWVAQHVFIEHVAGKTMRHMKREAEAAARGRSGVEARS